MKVSLSSLNTLLEQVESESDIILSSDRGDYQGAFKGDPFDYVYDSAKDIFTVVRLNSKAEKLSDKKVARLEKAVGKIFGPGTKSHDILTSRMRKSDDASGDKGKKKVKGLSKGQKLSAEFLKTSSVGGKRISPAQVHMTFSLLDDDDVKKLSKVADSPGKYAVAITEVAQEVVSLYTIWVPAIEAFEALGGFAAAKLGAFGTGRLAAFLTAAGGLKGFIIAGVPVAITSLYASFQLEKLDLSEIEVILSDLRPAIQDTKPKTVKELAAALDEVKEEDKEIGADFLWDSMRKVSDGEYSLMRGHSVPKFSREPDVINLLNTSLESGTAQGLYDEYTKLSKQYGNKIDLVDELENYSIWHSDFREIVKDLKDNIKRIDLKKKEKVSLKTLFDRI